MGLGGCGDVLKALEPAQWGCAAAAGEGWLASSGALSSVVPVGGCLFLICGAELPPALLAEAQNPAMALVLPEHVFAALVAGAILQLWQCCSPQCRWQWFNGVGGEDPSCSGGLKLPWLLRAV